VKKLMATFGIVAGLLLGGAELTGIRQVLWTAHNQPDANNWLYLQGNIFSAPSFIKIKNAVVLFLSQDRQTQEAILKAYLPIHGQETSPPPLPGSNGRGKFQNGRRKRFYPR
jgi:hypothetical protein